MKHTNIIRHTICIICTTILFVDCYPQPRKQIEDKLIVNCIDCNLMDAQGKKFGLWIERKGSVEVYYKNNLRDGIYKSYSRKNRTLHTFGEYSEGIPCGRWYYFNESANLLFTVENIEENTKYTRKEDGGSVITPKFVAYLKDYYSNGIVKEEGLVLYEDDIEVDCYKTGPWKYYDKEGKLIETKEEQE